jgi:glutathione synthase/RimK-type ligase-like ATP-grasp enzyme
MPPDGFPTNTPFNFIFRRYWGIDIKGLVVHPDYYRVRVLFWSRKPKTKEEMIIRSSGFEIPETLITTDPSSALAFWQRHKIVIYKSISSVRSIVSRLSGQHIDRLNDVRWCPTQFQRYISGVNFRVHVIGDKVFACQILSNADDYRYPEQQGEKIEIIPSDLPENISYRCKALTNKLGLSVSGIDLKITSEGKWYCFEVNPSPAFNYYQQAAKQPIDEAIVNLLKRVNSSIVEGRGNL